MTVSEKEKAHALYQSLQAHRLVVCAGKDCEEKFIPYSSRHIYHRPWCNPNYINHGYEYKQSTTKACCTCKLHFSTPFPRQRFCGDNCRQEWYDTRKVEGTRRECKHCGEVFVGKGEMKYCGEDCRKQAKQERDS